MIKYQIAYKIYGDEKELSFYIVTGNTIIEAILNFMAISNIYENATIYSVLRCGKP